MRYSVFMSIVFIIVGCGGGSNTQTSNVVKTVESPGQLVPERVEINHDFDGIWIGNVYQKDGSIHEYPAVMYIDSNSSSYTIDYPTLECGETLTLTKESKTEFQFNVELIYGFNYCTHSGKLTLSKKSNNELNWKWYRKSTTSPTVNGIFKKDTFTRSDITGIWKGKYTCAQGITGLTLTIDDVEVHELSKTKVLESTFSFYAVDENPIVPSGKYSMKEKLFNGQKLKFGVNEWIERPLGYTMVSLDGRVSEDGKKYEGNIGGAGSCTTFSLTKVK